MAQDYRPDGGRHADPERMKRINFAYEVLADTLKKQRYDEAYRTHQQQRTADFAPPPPGETTSRAPSLHE
jgi:DnaJ-class molecular chaperone